MKNMRKKKLMPHPVYGGNGTIVVLRIPEGTSAEDRREAMARAKQMADNESTSYVSSYRSRRYARKNQTGLFF